MNANYIIAGLPVYMSPRFSPLRERALPYRADTKEKALINVSLSDAIYKEYHLRFPDADDALIEYMATGAGFYAALLKYDGILLHASAVEMDGNAYLFSASSGVGKSTHTAFWLEMFPERATILNDDKPAIRLFPDGVYAYGTPWSGKTDLNLNHKVPLKGIAFLERSDRNAIFPLSGKACVPLFLEQTLRARDPLLAFRMLDHIDALIRRVPMYRLRCLPHPDAARLAYAIMKKGVVK